MVPLISMMKMQLCQVHPYRHPDDDGKVTVVGRGYSGEKTLPPKGAW